MTTTFKMPASKHGHAWSPGFASYYQESGGLHLPHNCAVSLRVLIGSTAISLIEGGVINRAILRGRVSGSEASDVQL